MTNLMNSSEGQYLREYYNEKNEAENYLNTNKMLFERELKNGLGEQMINELNNPPKPKKTLAVKVKIARFFERLFSIL